MKKIIVLITLVLLSGWGCKSEEPESNDIQITIINNSNSALGAIRWIDSVTGTTKQEIFEPFLPVGRKVNARISKDNMPDAIYRINIYKEKFSGSTEVVSHAYWSNVSYNSGNMVITVRNHSGEDYPSTIKMSASGDIFNTWAAVKGIWGE